eukprot:754345-Hanusia_phi.AAC.2
MASNEGTSLSNILGYDSDQSSSNGANSESTPQGADAAQDISLSKTSDPAPNISPTTTPDPAPDVLLVSTAGKSTVVEECRPSTEPDEDSLKVPSEAASRDEDTRPSLKRARMEDDTETAAEGEAPSSKILRTQVDEQRVDGNDASQRGAGVPRPDEDQPGDDDTSSANREHSHANEELVAAESDGSVASPARGALPHMLEEKHAAGNSEVAVSPAGRDEQAGGDENASSATGGKLESIMEQQQEGPGGTPSASTEPAPAVELAGGGGEIASVARRDEPQTVDESKEEVREEGGSQPGSENTKEVEMSKHSTGEESIVTE